MNKLSEVMFDEESEVIDETKQDIIDEVMSLLE